MKRRPKDDTTVSRQITQHSLGDYVVIERGAGSLTWQIIGMGLGPTAITDETIFTLESGQTGRRRYAKASEFSSYRRFTA
jgi:hypothetical protein